MVESEYKIGDIVVIKHLSRGDDYRFGLNEDMIEASGKSFTIKSIEPASISPCGIPDDGYRYKLEGIGWSWVSSMFVDPSEDTIIAGNDNIDAFIRKKKCPELDFNL